jgi:uncharacterized OB-fold protein
MADYAKPLPVPDPVTRPFWDSLKAHAMQLQKCGDCGRHVFYPRAVCPHCFSKNLAWTPASGRGRLHTFALSYQPPSQAFAGEVPYIIALVELEEGVRMMSTLVGVPPDPEKVRIGMPLEIVYDDVTDAVTLPKFRPAG